MNKILEQQLLEQCLALYSTKHTTVGTNESVISTDKYLSQERHRQEIDEIFKRCPSPILHSSELPERNSAKPVDTALGSLIVSRDSEGTIHVHHNMCRHRGTQLIQKKVCAKRLICPYHAWSYGLDGQLKSIPNKETCFPSLDIDKNALFPIPAVEMYGFLWICPATDNAALQLKQHLDNMSKDLSWLQAEDLTVFKRSTQTRHGNWKLFAEGGLETYHFSCAHRHSIAPHFFNNLAVINALGHHFRVVMPLKSLLKAKNDGADYSLKAHAHTLLYLLPSSALLIQKEHVEWIQFRPCAVNQTEISVTTLVPTSDDRINHWEKNHTITNQTLNEDWALGESIQRSIESGALSHLQYGRNEWALAAFHQRIEQLLSSNS